MNIAHKLLKLYIIQKAVKNIKSLPGGENPQGFHRSPAGSENLQGFHPFAKPVPDSGRKNSGMAGVPLRGAKTRRVFIPAFVLFPIRFSPIPNSCRKNSGMAGRAPPYGGCASPSGAQCRRKGVLCLPGTMPDWGRMNR
ncbi:MAG: hypothetical protein LBK61_01980 [Spirochaetaceae bacterium]|nr:hypothetical protein [Spirochaetaceae bacterium]